MRPLALRRQPVRRLSAVLAAVVLVALAGCTDTRNASTTADDPGLLHVHGLAVDPADDDALFVATHTGLFHVVGGEVERVGDAWHDLMGFTIADDGTFYASGHPDLQDGSLRVDGGDPHLGLVRSTDRGHTWKPVSLLGEADFHALTFAGSTIIGADATSGQLLASGDGGSTWQARSHIELISVASHPDDADLLVGSTTDHLVHSDDGGRTWADVGGSSPGFVTTHRRGFAVAYADGTVATSDDGTTWERQGALAGTPEALHGATGRLHVAVVGHGLFISSDGGTSWSLVAAYN